MEEEQWKPVGTSDVYQVSDAGRVKNSKTGRVKTISYDFQGNAMVYLYENHKKQKKKVSRLVAESFLHGDVMSSYIHYNDGSKKHVDANNLTLEPKTKGKKIRVVETGEVYDSISEASKYIGLSRSRISRCVGYPFNSNKFGYHFEFIE